MTTLIQVHEATAQRFGMTAGQLGKRDRKRRIAWPRQLAMLIARQIGFSYSAIARFYGIDHGSVIHGVTAAEARDSDPAWLGHRECVTASLGYIRPPERVERPWLIRSIPETKQDEYRFLTRKKGYTASEAKEMLMGVSP